VSCVNLTCVSLIQPDNNNNNNQSPLTLILFFFGSLKRVGLGAVEPFSGHSLSLVVHILFRLLLSLLPTLLLPRGPVFVQVSLRFREDVVYLFVPPLERAPC
jgi:hypothetical protein